MTCPRVVTSVACCVQRGKSEYESEIALQSRLTYLVRKSQDARSDEILGESKGFEFAAALDIFGLPKLRKVSQIDFHQILH